MICDECKGRGYIKLFRHARMPCLECGGSGIVSCCDAAGACAMPASDLVKKTDMDPEVAYRDDMFEERACDRCERLYRGPAVYCSFRCAVADA